MARPAGTVRQHAYTLVAADRDLSASARPCLANAPTIVFLWIKTIMLFSGMLEA